MTVDADSVQRFANAWTTAPAPPDLTAYLPDADRIRRCRLVDLIRIDLEQRSLRGQPVKRLTEYVAELPDLQRVDLPADVIFAEFEQRRDRGEAVDVSDYFRDYPEQAAELSGLLDIEITEFAEQTAFSDDPPYSDETDSTRETSNTVSRPRRFDPIEQIEVGQTVDEFDLLTPLGSGAFARVFLARQRSMQRLVAVKVSEDRGTEPQTLAQLDHDYIVRVFDQRILQDQGLRLLYMQYLPGGTLLGVLHMMRKNTWTPDRTGQLLLDAIDDAMEAKGEIRPSDSSIRDEIAQLSWPETVAWLGRRLAEALDYAGRHDVLHRDIKPANILLTAEGIPKLADFNISFSGRIRGTSPIAYFGGSLSYMSPEQLEACQPTKSATAADLDTRSDIYSLGVVLWELLTGRKPFPDKRFGEHLPPSLGSATGDDTVIEAMLEHRHAGVAEDAMHDLPPDTPAALRRILLTCMAPDPDNRWANGADLAQQLDLCLDSHARALVDPPQDSWRLRLRQPRWGVPLIALAMAVPNLLAGFYNVAQNQIIVSKLSPDVLARFERIVTINNVLSYSIGAVLVLFVGRRLLSVSIGLRKGRSYSAATLAHARTDAVMLSERLVAVAFGLWVAFGIAWPIGLQLAGGGVPTRAFLHFAAAQIVCGAIAVAYPFFLVSFYGIRCVYPVFLLYGRVSHNDARRLRLLRRRANVYLAVAASVPLLGIASVTFLQSDEVSAVIVPVRYLCLGTIAAFVGSYWLFRQLEGDLDALARVVATNE